MLARLLGMVPARQKGKLLQAAMGALGGGGGLAGLSGMLSKFQGAGLQGKADSWVGGGPNQNLTPDEVGRALGDDQVAQIAQQAGMSPQKAKKALSRMIPDAVNDLTPEGRMPESDDALQGALSALRGRFKM